MDYNTILNRFGFDSTNFVNKSLNAIETENGFIYEAEEAYKQSMCPNCNNEKFYVHSYKWIEIKLSTTIGFMNILELKE